MNKPAKIEKPSGVIDIRGKQYQTVAYRVQQFREAHPEWELNTLIVDRDEECVVVKALIANEDGRVLATGHAEEYRKASQINRTSALENAETSAIGRALAALGFGGTEFATANEVQNAIHQQGTPPADIGTGEQPPKKREKLDGPYTSKTALWAAVKSFVHTANGMGSNDEFVPFLETDDVKELLAQCERDAPGLLRDGLPDVPEYEPLELFIARKKREFEELESIANSSGAKMVRAG